MYFTYFPEFEHIEKLKELDLSIHIIHPVETKMIDSDNPVLTDIYKNNLKLFFDKQRPPTLSVLDALNKIGFTRTFHEKDRWIFHWKGESL
jgi:hypothetical protein